MSEPGTPLPWRLFEELDIIGADGDEVTTTEYSIKRHEFRHADAAYIVEACNAYPHLVAALRKLVEAAREQRYVLWETDADANDIEANDDAMLDAIAEAERLLGEAT